MQGRSQIQNEGAARGAWGEHVGRGADGTQNGGSP